MTTSVALLNQKGGVGKTTVALGLASSAWSQGIRTLVIDLDAQANATWALGVDPSPSNYGTGDALAANRQGAAAEMIVVSGWGEHVWILPAGGDLIDRETETGRVNATLRLRKALDGVTERFDLVLIDCAPSLGLNTRSGLAASDGALIVAEPTIFGLRGIGPVLEMVKEVAAADNPKLNFAGVILNRVPGVSSDAQLRTDQLIKQIGARSVWKPYIPHRVIINEAHAERAPIHAFKRAATDISEPLDALLKILLRKY